MDCMANEMLNNCLIKSSTINIRVKELLRSWTVAQCTCWVLKPFDFKDYEFNNDEKIEDIFQNFSTVGKEKDNFETEEDNNGDGKARKYKQSQCAARRGSGDGGGGGSE